MAELDLGFGTPWQDQIDFLRQKLRLPTERWDDIMRSAHDRAFIVAGAAKADLLADLHESLVQAAADGRGLDAWRREFRGIVEKHGWRGWTGDGTKGGEAWRTRVIYQTNMATSYAAGRYRQLTQPAFLKLNPFWRYIHSDSVMHPRPLHLSWHGLTLRHDHPFWQTHFPPNGWGCQCRVTAVSRREGEASARAGLGVPPDGWDAIDGKTGAQVGIDKGFDYTPGASVDRPLRDFIATKLLNLHGPIGARMWEALGMNTPAEVAGRSAAFSDFVDATLSGPPRGKLFTAGALKPAWVDAAVTAEIAPATAEIIVRDADVWHTFRDAKKEALDLDWYKRLPALLDHPGAVVLDTTHKDAPAFLLFFDTNRRSEKLVVRVNYRVKKVGVVNIVETGRKVDLSGVRAMIGHGYKLIEGGL